jgi:tRNA-specific 2-thiouridylase
MKISNGMKKKVVFVGLSGGVDSSVSAALLKKAGYEVVGVFMKTWHPDFLECNEEVERLDAMRVAAHLDIPFLTFDFEKEYKKHVADYMISEYKLGRTPNPDVMCNREVKFGAFLKKALSMGADYVATGHYAQIFQMESAKLLKGVDPSKDQSYFLWTLTQKELLKILFPVGHLKKSQVRALAKKFKLPVAEKRDSQGVCFLGDVDLKEFLKHYIKSKKGKVVNEKREEIGHHDGAVFFTLGERHGFVITKKSPIDGPYYVVGKDIKKNILIVSQNPKSSDGLIRANRGIVLKDVNWISDPPDSKQQKAKTYSCQIRYHGEFLACKVKVLKSNKTEPIFDKPILAAPGQSVVIYDKDIVIGGGVIS